MSEIRRRTTTCWAGADNLLRFALHTLGSGGKSSENTCKMLEPPSQAPSSLEHRITHKFTQGLLTRPHEVNRTLV
jgi:hypothetical protein